MTYDTDRTPANYYASHPRHYVAVDCLVFGVNAGKLQLLLIERDFEPGKGRCSLMGGFVEKGEDVDGAALRVLTELTGLCGIFMEQTGTFGAVGRDPGERVISVAYCALVNYDDLDQDVLRAHNAFWVDIESLPPLLFDHREMVDRALRTIRRRFKTEPLAYNLLPASFTLTRLQSLCETVLGEAIDKRNFRKRAVIDGCVVPTGEIDKTTSRHGAMLYRFDRGAYELSSGRFRLC